MDIQMTKQLGDFVLLESKEFPCLMFTAYIYEHKIFKSKFLYIKTDDRQNTFSATFNTIPCDDIGESHILEHLILDGSEKYPIPQVFDELRKRSYATYMNAATAPEQTYFPFSNISEVDFLNNMDVYLDCIFHPQLTQDDFLQECHYIYFEDNDPSKKLIHGGVIYNEMLGSISNKFTTNSWNVRKNLFPDSTSRFLSGGNPPDVAKATIQDIKKHYAKYYHPSNAIFYLYGSIDPKQVFEKVSNTIKEFDDVKTVIDKNQCHQKSWKEPRTVEFEGPTPQNEKPENSHTVNITWKVGKSADVLKADVMKIVAQYLFITDKGPLKQGLVETGFAKDVMVYYDMSFYDAIFTIDAMGVKESDVQIVSEKIIEIITKTFTEELDKDMLDSVISKLMREVLIPSDDMGLKYLHAVNRFNVLGISPLSSIDYSTRLKAAKKIIEDEDALRKYAQKYLIENKHRLTSHVIPVVNFFEQKKLAAEKDLEEIKSKLTEEEIKEIIETHKRVQKNISSPRKTHLLPRIKKEDIPRKSFFVAPTKVLDNVTYFKQPTNGLASFQLLGRVKFDHALLDLTALMINVVNSVGAGDRDEYQLQEFVARYMTLCSIECRHVEDEHLEIFLYAVALEEDIDKVIELIKDVIIRPRINTPERVKIEIAKLVHRFRMMAALSADYYGGCIADATRSIDLAAEEAINGLHGDKRVLAFIESHSVEEIIALCERLHREIIQQAEYKVYVNGGQLTEESLGKLQAMTEELNALPKVDYERANIPMQVMNAYAAREGTYLQFDITTGFSFVEFAAPKRNDKRSASIQHLSKLMKYEFLWREIRERLGAYSAYANYDAGRGTLQISSYRDTRNRESLEAMINVLREIAAGNITQAMVDNAAVQILAAVDAPTSPINIGVFEAKRGITAELMQAKRDWYFAATPEDLAEAARFILEGEPYRVISSSQKVCECPEGFVIDSL